MKVSKLFKIGAVALMVSSLCFVGCKDEEDDDENGMISGSNNNYTLSYDNSASSDTSRGYVATRNNHLGALCTITLNKDYTNNGAAMGYIWDLSSTDASASADEVARAVSSKPRNFCIVGFANFSGTYKAYVSRYTNVYDIQANNFGTDGVDVNGTKQTAVETEYIKSSDNKTLTAVDGAYIMTVNVYEEKDGEGNTTGGYVVDIYNGAVAKADLGTTEKLTSYTIPASDLGYDTAKKATQKQGAVYANVYAGSKVTGSWKYLDTYSADEVVEE
ncbi:MAG: hypothetical protein II821_00225 [Treponema sp.]|nr:hypothetical protein [Treponema sp.]